MSNESVIRPLLRHPDVSQFKLKEVLNYRFSTSQPREWVPSMYTDQLIPMWGHVHLSITLADAITLVSCDVSSRDDEERLTNEISSFLASIDLSVAAHLKPVFADLIKCVQRIDTVDGIEPTSKENE